MYVNEPQVILRIVQNGGSDICLADSARGVGNLSVRNEPTVSVDGRRGSKMQNVVSQLVDMAKLREQLLPLAAHFRGPFVCLGNPVDVANRGFDSHAAQYSPPVLYPSEIPQAREHGCL